MKIQDYCETKKCDCSDCEINKNHESGNCEKLFDAYTLGYNKAIDDFQEWIKTQIVGLDNTTKEILIGIDDRWELATDKFKERGANDN